MIRNMICFDTHSRVRVIVMSIVLLPYLSYYLLLYADAIEIKKITGSWLPDEIVKSSRFESLRTKETPTNFGAP